MNLAVNKINQAIQNNEQICIIGDYDADGVTATSVLYIGLRSLGANVTWQLPNRFIDGYGINKRLIDNAYHDLCKLIITVDNGVAALEPIKYAESLGIDVIVTDHHQIPDQLPTKIVINPHLDDNYPFKTICGCMVAFKLISALIPNMMQNDPQMYEELVSIVTIGTIADAMDLTDENRFFVKQGLNYLANTNNIGLRVLMQKLDLYQKVLNADDVGYLIGPCINAAGRLESPDIAMNLILCDDEVVADKLSDKIIKLNDKRKEIQLEVVNNLQINEDDNFIIVTLDDVGHGILGIIAGKIAEKYQRPCFVLGINAKENKLSGSGRSVFNYNISDVIKLNPDILSGGGHAAACGLSLKYDNLNELKLRCNEHFKNWLANATIDDLTPTLEAVCEIDLGLINDRLINNLDKLKPYGNGNSEPLFVSRKVEVRNLRIVGKNKNVVQMQLGEGWSVFNSIGFNDIKEKYEQLGKPKIIDVLYSVDFNEWPQGKFNPQLNIQDIKVAN
jgi:single-stranded-DNA-specific exonuclease